MTRFAVLSDVHANLRALTAVLTALEGEHVDRYLSLGDMVGYGARPEECVQLLQGLPLVAVAGNHDLVAVGRAPAERCESRLARRTLAWTRPRLSAETRGYLRSLPLATGVEQLVLTHGSLRDPFEYVRTSDQAVQQLDQLERSHPQAQLLLHGHTHRAWAVGQEDGLLTGRRRRRIRLRPGQRYLLNPGSVGQSRERSARARFLVLDTDCQEVAFHAVGYDLRACREELVEAGLPPEGCHRPPPFALAARRALRRHWGHG